LAVYKTIQFCSGKKNAFCWTVKDEKEKCGNSAQMMQISMKEKR